MSEAHVFALGMALACLAGVRAYFTVFGVGIAGLMGWIELPVALEVTTSPWVLGTAGALALTEFFADKIPGVDSGWDLVQTLARIPAGAWLAAATLSDDGTLGSGALALGAGAALGTHALKAGSRVLLNASPEPLSNWTASLGEDATAVAAIGLVFAHPFLALALVLGVMLTMTAVLVLCVRWLWRRRPGASRPLRQGPAAA
ncbi:DUF4126 domain-containing protein [Arenimonas composti]|uniref:DUF4126 domain-containing protein n=1 Tax=Arenimonas composti TR7-09 = DSM 18010 TaxID=1121013 RepID=A0A091BEH6_9GAMM|nr:DUF4126 domain-containing protein [Arenimonas composti]KFN49219.1 hypothetical protein P873_12245 [Arenimonas composti TR7-09 = DSM 18010]